MKLESSQRSTPPGPEVGAEPSIEPHAGFAGLELPPPTALLRALEEVPPVVAAHWTAFANSILTHGHVPPDMKEVAILRTAVCRKAAYIEHAHRLIGRHLGLSARDVELVTDPRSTARDFVHNRLAGAVLSSTDQLLQTGEIDERTRAVLAAELGAPNHTELAMIVGQYETVSLICRVNGLEPEPVRKTRHTMHRS
ncbi:MAG: carboxymuconolactone decarboxylase family protein [Actinomycetota bacterium]